MRMYEKHGKKGKNIYWLGGTNYNLENFIQQHPPSEWKYSQSTK
jgi:hypothetical protein